MTDTYCLVSDSKYFVFSISLSTLKFTEYSIFSKGLIIILYMFKAV